MRGKKDKKKKAQSQRDALIADFNTSDFVRPKFKHAIELFEEQAKKTPENIAIEFGQEKVTYRELDEKATAVGNFLTDFLLKNQQKIYIFADSSPDLIISLFGVLKSGNILLPLDPGYPPKKIVEIFKEIRPDFFIIQKKYADIVISGIKKLSNLNALVIDAPEAGVIKKNNLTLINRGSLDKYAISDIRKKRADNIPYAYIYFTSGSTGKPKAVVTPNLSASLHSEQMLKGYLKKDSRVAHFFPAHMHTSLRRGILPTLCNGATYCIPKNDKLLFDVDSLFDWLECNKITLLSFPTVFFKYFAEKLRGRSHLRDLRYIFVLTDKLNNDKYLRRFFDRANLRIKLINIYGSSEAGMGFAYRVGRADLKKDLRFLPIGKSAAGKALVVGKNNEVVLPGGIGEIYFRSPYISAGYFNDPEMTARVFIQNPFSQKTNDIVYCSGDLGQLLPNGHIQCLGRLDYQIKIGGYRIELGEIESALTKHPAIKDCVVTVLKNDILTAYFTCNKKIAAAELAAFLKGKLPGHMIPSFYVPLKKIPLNSSNKIDRAALPKPGRQHLAKSGNLIKARRELEQKILIVWRAVLNVEKIGVTDNFFDLGGNSLRAIQASSQLKKILGINLSAMMIFRYTTIASLVNYLENKEEGVVSQANKTIGKNEKNRILLSQAIKLLKKKKIKR